MRLHHVQVSCPSGGEEAARAFYAGALGLTEVPKPPSLAARGGVWFRQQGVELHVGVDTDFTPARKAHPGFEVVDVEAAARQVEAAGFPVAWDHALTGFRRFYTADGAGNRVELLQPLG
jgi:catechol 2,3-dioxygenase-like lactoylglutathione lyase family enzyme